MPPNHSISIDPARFPHDKDEVTTLFCAYADSLGIDLKFQDFATELTTLPGKYADENGGALLLARWRLPASPEPEQPEQSTKPDTEVDAGIEIDGGIDIKGDTDMDNDTNTNPGDPVLGMASLRALPAHSPTTCELKRLYVVPSDRGLGIGKRLLDEVLRVARAKGYKRMVLDTLPSMRTARTMYEGAGFGVVERYYDTPVVGTVFMGVNL